MYDVTSILLPADCLLTVECMVCSVIARQSDGLTASTFFNEIKVLYMGISLFLLTMYSTAEFYGGMLPYCT